MGWNTVLDCVSGEGTPPVPYLSPSTRPFVSVLSYSVRHGPRYPNFTFLSLGLIPLLTPHSPSLLFPVRTISCRPSLRASPLHHTVHDRLSSRPNVIVFHFPLHRYHSQPCAPTGRRYCKTNDVLYHFPCLSSTLVFCERVR